MRTIKINLYKFNELSKDAQMKALDELHSINIDQEWWCITYDDASQIGLKITGFDIGRSNDIGSEFINDAQNVADLILENHGEESETHGTAKLYLSEVDNLIDDRNENEDSVYDDEMEELESNFLKSLSEDYLILLRDEYQYLITYEAIKETIEANEYDFTEDGKMY